MKSLNALVLVVALLSLPARGEEPSAGLPKEPCKGIAETPADFLIDIPGAGQVPPGSGSTGQTGAQTGKPPSGDNAGTPAPGANPGAGGTSSKPGSSGVPAVGNYFLDNLNRNTGSGSANTVLTLQNAMTLSQLARGNEFASESLEKTAQFRASESSDRGILEKQYDQLSYQELNSRLKRAEGELVNMSRYLDESRPSELNPADQAFFRNTFANAADKAQIAQTLLQEAKDKDKKFTREQVRELLDQAKQDQSSLVDRLLLLNGLAEKERQELVNRLNLAEQVKIVLPDGRTRKIPLLHNGYLNSSGRSDLDCPTFVAATLSPKFRKANLTTLDLRGIWSLSRTGHLPQGVKWAKGRQEVLKKVSTGFEAVDLYLGEKPLPGDLLVHRVLSETNGRVAVVKSYDPKKLVARVAEPSSDGTRLIEYDFSLSDDPEDKPYRGYRPGLANLRLLPDQSAACNYRNAKEQAPANRREASSRQGAR